LKNQTDDVRLELEVPYTVIPAARRILRRLNMRKSLLTAALVLVTTALFWACGAPPAVTPTPKSLPASNTPPEIGAVQPAPLHSDGIISPGEYSDNQTYGDCQLYWKNDDQYVYIGIKAKTTGFVAVGIQPGTTMLDADIIMGYILNGQPQVFDMYSTGPFGPHPQDTELGGTDDVLSPAGTDDGQYTVIEFKRALDTGDKYDNALVKGANKIIWAYGPNKDVSFKHTARGYGQINIK
jgi:hypothetical protein